MATQVIELCKNAYSHYLRADNENKRLLLKILCSNFLWDGENVVIKLKSTVEPMLLGGIKNGGRKDVAAVSEIGKLELY